MCRATEEEEAATDRDRYSNRYSNTDKHRETEAMSHTYDRQHLIDIFIIYCTSHITALHMSASNTVAFVSVQTSMQVRRIVRVLTMLA